MKKIVAMIFTALQMAVLEWTIVFHLANKADMWAILTLVSFFGTVVWLIILSSV